ncbi:unnamed protein product [Miscanthus lutarioriparius]|uniref:Uncharacterized protein n=1 Tax=Miscanthus lutarioriparius TaxID=422564 RepID=A0A811RJ02_9POAL|nr:unnamed protein product [Miscanthus lutarioriparius]
MDACDLAGGGGLEDGGAGGIPARGMRGRVGFQREAGAASTAGTGSPREADASGAGVAARPGAGTARMTSAAGAGTARMAGADRALSSHEWPMRPRRASHASLARPGRPAVQGEFTLVFHSKVF